MKAAPLLFATVLGAALASTGWYLAGSRDQPSAGEGADEGSALVLARLDRLDERLADIEGALGERALEAGRRSAGPGLSGTAAASSGAASGGAGGTDRATAAPTITAEAIAEALKQAEAQKWASKKNSELLMEGNRRLQTRDALGAAEIFERLLERDLEKEDRAQALTQLGAARRAAGDGEASVEALEEAVRVAGRNTQAGQTASYQLVWSHATNKDYDAAAIEVDRLLRTPRLPAQTEQYARWAAVVVAQQRGDAGAADQSLEDFRTRYGESDRGKQLIADLERRREALDGN